MIVDSEAPASWPDDTADQLQRFLEHVPAMVSMKGLDGEVLLTNVAAATGGHLGSFAVEDDPRSILVREAADSSSSWTIRHNEVRVATTGIAETFEESALLVDGEHWYSSVRFPVFDSAGEVIGVGAISTDITESKKLDLALSKAHRVLERRALHDSLTGLPNRAQLIERLDALATMGPQSTALLFVDLDDFKDINDTHGHAEGDLLLRNVATRLRGCIRPGDLLARLGGDEFGVLLEGKDTAAAEILAQRIVEAMALPFVVAGESVRVTASVGIAASNLDGEDPNELLCFADLAMYEAKSKGKGRFASFDSTMSDALASRTQTDADLRGAIDKGELVLHYQPIIDLTTGKMIGVEALVRWQHPERGLVGPDEFIPMAERTGAIVALGAWVMRTACRQGAEWTKARPGRKPLTISVNVSARQLDDPAFISTVSTILDATGLDPAQLCLEVTETAMAANPSAAQEVVHALRYLGVGLAIDDFGTGYASLTYLRRLHATVVKIDRSFVDGLGREIEDTTIVKAVIGLSKAMGLAATAEGVETLDQLVILRELGCPFAQGYYFCRPVPAEELSDRLEQLWLDPPTLPA